MVDALERSFGPNWGTVIFTNLFFLIFAVAFLRLCWRFGSTSQERGLNLLSALIGALLGWGLGMFFAPYTSDEQAVFAGIGKTVSAFMSGYVVSKLDRFLEGALFEDKRPVASSWIRMGLLSGSLILALLVVFSNRAYFRTKPQAGGAQSTNAPKLRTDTLESVAMSGRRSNQLMEQAAPKRLCKFATYWSRPLIS